MTGLYPDQTLVRRNPIFIRQRLPSVVTMPQAFRPHTPYVAPKKYFEDYPPKSIARAIVPAGYADTIPPAALETLRRKSEHYNISEESARKAMQAYYASISFADAQVGRSTSSLAELIDIYPTLTELIGLPPPAQVSGVSLAPVLSDPMATPRASAMTQLKDTNYSIRTAHFRYTEWGKDGTGGAELYDHRFDPAEMMNLAEDPGYRDTQSRLAKHLHGRIAKAQQPPEGIEQIRSDE
jgi:iduronate 2-sulfatase